MIKKHENGVTLIATGSWDDYKDNQDVEFEGKKYHVVKDRKELKKLLYYNKSNLNNLVPSLVTTFVTNFSRLFVWSSFNGDIGSWDTSNAVDMSGIFIASDFNGDISKWNTSKVTNMGWMFESAEFNGDISKWDVSNVTNMENMFRNSQFNGDISNWDVSNVSIMDQMFLFSKFSGDISNWNLSNLNKVRDIIGFKTNSYIKINLYKKIYIGFNKYDVLKNIVIVGLLYLSDRC